MGSEPKLYSYSCGRWNLSSGLRVGIITVNFGYLFTHKPSQIRGLTYFIDFLIVLCAELKNPSLNISSFQNVLTTSKVPTRHLKLTIIDNNEIVKSIYY